jgi:protein-disulfide isomerase
VGSPDAPVTVVEFTSYLCQPCQRELPTVERVLESYVKDGKVRYEVQDIPQGSLEEMQVAEAADCAGLQHAYMSYHQALFSSQNLWRGLGGNELTVFLTNLASQVGLNAASFAACLYSGKMLHQVLRGQQLANAVGVSQLPAYLILGKLYEGPLSYARWQQILNTALEQASR